MQQNWNLRLIPHGRDKKQQYEHLVSEWNRLRDIQRLSVFTDCDRKSPERGNKHCFKEVEMSPEGLKDISGEQWLFGAFTTADSSYSAIQEVLNVQRGSESGNNRFNSFLQGGESFWGMIVETLNECVWKSSGAEILLFTPKSAASVFVCIFITCRYFLQLFLCHKGEKQQ